MKKILLITAAFVFFGFTLSAQEAPDTHSLSFYPRISFQSQSGGPVLGTLGSRIQYQYRLLSLFSLGFAPEVTVYSLGTPETYLGWSAQLLGIFRPFSGLPNLYGALSLSELSFSNNTGAWSLDGFSFGFTAGYRFRLGESGFFDGSAGPEFLLRRNRWQVIPAVELGFGVSF
ncbi:MAG: hypothetical protein ACLFST_09550 [Spirochaetia bacterium]